MKYLLLALITLSFISCASYNREPSSEKVQPRREIVTDFSKSAR